MDSPFIIDLNLSDDMENNVPFWLRDVFDRVLDSTGIRGRLASDEAIASLIKVDISQILDKDCPICYEKFQTEPIVIEESKAGEQALANKRVTEKLLQDKEFKENLLKEHGIYIEPLETTAKFNDPYMFFPTDLAAEHYSRFPQRNLATFRKVTIEDQFPGYKSEDKENKDKRIEKYKREGHIAVKMPECEHIFGLSCIVEWLKANVSCPLCRREVEAKRHDPKRVKRETIENNVVTNFNNRSDMIEHMMDHSTDVFNPFRRPFNPTITPVTDTHLTQEWATPSNYPRPLRSRDPNIVIPRKFPFGDPFVSTRRLNSLRRTTRDNRRTRNAAAGAASAAATAAAAAATTARRRRRRRRATNDSNSTLNSGGGGVNDDDDAIDDDDDIDADVDGDQESDFDEFSDGMRRRRSASNDSSRSARRVNFSPHTTNIDALQDTTTSESESSSIDSASPVNPPASSGNLSDNTGTIRREEN